MDSAWDYKVFYIDYKNIGRPGCRVWPHPELGQLQDQLVGVTSSPDHTGLGTRGAK